MGAGDPALPSYAGAPFFGLFTFDRNDFVNAPHTETIPLSVTQHADSPLVGTADVSWNGTVTLTSTP